MFKKTLTTDFFTTISLKQALSSLYHITLGLPSLRFGKDIKKSEKALKSFLNAGNSKILSFYNARSALYQTLKALKVDNKDEVIISGYTCVSVSNAVIKSGAKIIYSDINKNTLGFDFKKLKDSVNKKTKVIIVQHTFGKTSEVKKIVKYAHDKGIIIIEDCAHSLGTYIDEKMTGLFGDFAIFSTGRDKVISSVTGGFLLVNTPAFFKKFKKIKAGLVIPSRVLTVRNHFYNIIAYKAYKSYDFFGLGKMIIFLSRKLGIITQILSKNEKQCNYNKLNYKLPNSLATLALSEIRKLHKYKRERRAINQYYDITLNKKARGFLKESKGEKFNSFRYPILLKTTSIKNDFVTYMKKNKVILGTSWTGLNIAPIGSNISQANYKSGSCKVAEDISSRLVLLPNNKLLKKVDIDRIINLINNFFTK